MLVLTTQIFFLLYKMKSRFKGDDKLSMGGSLLVIDSFKC